MAITIHLSTYACQTNETLLQRIQFIYSPLNELFRSLHVLLNPRHHGTNIDWALSTKALLSREFFKDLYYFRNFFELGTSPLLLCNFQYNSTSIDEEIYNLECYLPSLSSDKIINILNKTISNRENSFIPSLAKGLEWNDYIPHTENDLIYDLKTDPSAVYSRLFSFIRMYNDTIFQHTWKSKELSSKILSEIENQSLFLHQHNAKILFDRLQSDRIYCHNNTLIIIKPFEEVIQLKDTDSIILIPSFFIWPHLFVDQFNKGIAITYDITESPADLSATAEQLTTIFKALSDPLRLQIVSYLSKQPSTTQSLAQVFLMSPSSISRHLQILKDSHLLQSTKYKKFVLYKPTPLLTKLIPRFDRLLKTK